MSQRCRKTIGMKKFSLLFAVLGTILASCAPIYNYCTRTSTIKDITYETSIIDEAGHQKTIAYFILEDGALVPVSSNFNPCSTDSYIGKILTYTSIAPEGEQSQNQANMSSNSDDYSEYICQDKYVSDGKCFLRVFTSKKPAIRTIQVSAEAYGRAQKRQFILKSDIEPYIKKKNEVEK